MRELKVLILVAALLLGGCKHLSTPTEPEPPCGPVWVDGDDERCQRPSDLTNEPE